MLSFFGEENTKLKPTTAADMNLCSTPEGIRQWLQQHGYFHNRLVNAHFKLQRAAGLSDFDTYTLLAFNALLATEELEEQLLERVRREPGPWLMKLP